MHIGNRLELSLIHINQKVIYSWILFVFVVNTVMSVFFFWGGRILLNPQQLTFPLVGYFLWWQIQSLPAIFLILISLYFINPDNPLKRILIIILAVILGSFIGEKMCHLILMKSSRIVMSWNYLKMLTLNVKTNLIMDTVLLISFYMYWFTIEYIAVNQEKIRTAQIRRAESEQKTVESHLRLLQAQIEPHFLFNTLSNILALFDEDVEKGLHMQEDLIHYLKTSLPQLRVDAATLEQEMEMIQAYLNIFKIRMGDRLTYNIELPEDLKKLTFPPLLVQPLVENAIKHGIDPKIEGGEINIRIKEIQAFFQIEVADTGIGLQNDSGSNIGLSNIRDRIKALYGKNGRLILKENSPIGLKAIIEIAYEG